MDATKESDDWKRPIVKIGAVTLLLAAVLSFLPCLYLYVVHGVFPPLSVALKAWGLIAAIFGAFYIVEPISYYPILGLAGTYMSFLSGNISNLRLPCSAVAQEVVGVKAGTREAEIVSTLGIAGSVITNLVFVTLGAVAGFVLLGMLPDPVVTAFEVYTVPAIFGAVFGQFALRHPSIAAIALPIPLILFLFFHAPDWVVILGSVFGTIAISRILYIKGKIGRK
jgi:hypothetical protein